MIKTFIQNIKLLIFFEHYNFKPNLNHKNVIKSIIKTKPIYNNYILQYYTKLKMEITSEEYPPVVRYYHI